MGKQHRAKRPKRAREDLVVVNPTMVSSGTGGAENMQLISNNKRKQAPQKLPSHNADKNVCGSKLKKKKKKEQEQIKQQQENKKTISNKEAVLGVAELAGTEGPSCSVLRVKREADRMAGVYWILLTRNSPRPCVVALPNHYDLTPSQLAAMLRHVGFQAVALHSKMTSKQRKETVQRLKVAESTVVMHAMVVVTTDHLLPSTASTQAQVLLVDGVQAAAFQVATAKFAHVHLVTATDVESRKKLLSDYSSDLTTPYLQQLQTRLKLARQIVDLAQQIEKTGAATQKDDAKWARKLTKGADLWDDDEETGRITKKRKRALNPEEQRLQALTEKLYVMLARKLPESRSNPSSVSSGGERDVDQGQRSEKLEVLGLVTVKAAVGTAMTDERTSAQTRWMDFAEGCIYGGEWKGAIRHGASKDRTSLALRATFCADKATGSSYMNNWMPNKEPSDIETWGGEFGKACGHNEVVMHQLRPFYPQEVVNSKVCSKFFPAPGNQGFDGCLEHLRLACMAQSTSMTLWDAEYFIFISSRGHVTLSKKSQLLSLSLASLQCLVPALRSWTVANTGHLPVNTNLVAIQLCCRLGYGEKRGELPPKTIKRIISFVLGGSARLWRQIAKVPTPLEEETEYYSTTCN